MATEPAIRIRNLSKRFGPALALNDVSFDVPAQTVFGLLGPNGSGKTTLFSLAAGFLRPTAGSVEVLGINVEQVSKLCGRLSILPQDAQFQANVPIVEQMVFFGRLTGMTREEAKEQAFRALQIVGLADAAGKSARTLSHGMAKRLGIAQAFLGRPEVIILDEPTAGLDPANASNIRELIRSLKKSTTLVVSSHDLREIQEMCSHVAILDRGRLVTCSEVEALVQSTRRIRMSFARPLVPAETANLRQIKGLCDVTVESGDASYTLHIDLQLAGSTQDKMLADIMQLLLPMGLVPRSINEGASLETKFLEMTGRPTPGNRYCLNCRYDLFGLKGDRCPECGAQVNFSSPDRR